jgi:hypothetical protein
MLCFGAGRNCKSSTIGELYEMLVRRYCSYATIYTDSCARSGIRKTTSMYQEWFPRLLHEALVPPSSGNVATMTENSLPTGSNSFFRQLDHMIATLCNEEFTNLYALTRDMWQESTEEPSSDIVKAYSDLKAAIFTRYRTLSELLGVAC